jgi:hypothetical protein
MRSAGGREAPSPRVGIVRISPAALAFCRPLDRLEAPYMSCAASAKMRVWMSPRSARLRRWAQHVAARADPERRAMGKAILLLLTQIDALEAELAEARADPAPLTDRPDRPPRRPCPAARALTSTGKRRSMTAATEARALRIRARHDRRRAPQIGVCASGYARPLSACSIDNARSVSSN